MDLPIPIGVWFSGPLVGVRSWIALFPEVWFIFCLSVWWAWAQFTVVLGVVTWWASVCRWSVIWLVWCVKMGSAAVASVCWVGLPWAASIVDVPIPLLWSQVASVQVMMAGAAISAIPRLWSGPVSPDSIFLAASRVWPGVAVFVHLVMLCWHAWRWYLVRAVHDYMSIFFAFMASDVRAVSCNVSWFLALKTSVILIWHHGDHWWWKDGCSKLMCCIQFIYLSNGILESLRIFFCRFWLLNYVHSLVLLRRSWWWQCHLWNYSIWLLFWTDECKLLVIPSPTVVYPWSVRCMCEY